MRVYRGGYCAVEAPEIRPSRNNKDFGKGFYCTEMQAQAERWASRYDTAFVSVFEYTEPSDIEVLKFETMTEEWLDFIVDCRSGKLHCHEIVTGAMANDTIWRFVNNYINGLIPREAFWIIAKFRHPTHQIVFCSERLLNCLNFIESYEVAK
jgi:hypothetical protein